MHLGAGRSMNLGRDLALLVSASEGAAAAQVQQGNGCSEY